MTVTNLLTKIVQIALKIGISLYKIYKYRVFLLGFMSKTIENSKIFSDCEP